MKKNKYISDYFNESGIFFINGEINSNTYIELAEGLRHSKHLEIPRIHIYINSGGGELEAALAIIDDFKIYEKNNKEIYTIAVGEACSCGALILAYGTKRFATENAVMMLHPISYDLGEAEHQSTKSYVNFAEKLYNNLMTSLAMRCGRKNSKEIKSFMDKIRDGHWMDVDGAIEFGLIDDKWDYSLEK